MLARLETGEMEFSLTYIPAGEFKMGSQNAFFGETPSRLVKIAEPFYIGSCLVTQRQWISVVGQNPLVFRISDDHPVDSVSWLEASHFCLLLSEMTGYAVRLPTEAEWEYACRGGTDTDFFFSPSGPFVDEFSVPQKVRELSRNFAWFDENRAESTHPVATKKPNPFGLYDMIGNVWEWCQDHWHPDYKGAPATCEPWVDSSPKRPLRCLRGGAWDMNVFRCRSAYRSWDWEMNATSRFGLRICVEDSGGGVGSLLPNS